MMVVVFAYMGYSKQQAYNQSFYTKYTIEDYNNPNIIYYNSELEKYMKDFIEANDIYTKFSTDTKVDLALACIEHFTEHYEAGYTKGNFRLHARNKYASDEDKIDKAKENSRFMDKNFYTYDFNTVSHIIDNLTEPSPITKRSLCDQRESVEELYKIFIPLYIPQYENFMKPSEKEKEPQQRHVKWLNSLKENHPQYFTNKEINIKIPQETEAKTYLSEVEIARLRESNLNKKKYDKAIKRKKNPIISAIIYKQNDELDKHIAEGIDLNGMSDSQYPRTALFIATLNNNTYAVQTLLTNGVDVYKMNSRDSYNGFLWAFSNSKVNEEIVNLYFDYNIDVNYQYKKGETALTLAAKGCNQFKKVQQLLEHGANPDLIDLYGQTTRSGLSRYCRNKDDYKKMMKLIESNDSFFKW